MNATYVRHVTWWGRLHWPNTAFCATTSLHGADAVWTRAHYLFTTVTAVISCSRAFSFWVGLLAIKKKNVLLALVKLNSLQTNCICMFQCMLRRHITPSRVAEGKLENFLATTRQFFHMKKPPCIFIWPQFRFYVKSIVLPNTIWKVHGELTVLEKFPTSHFTFVYY